MKKIVTFISYICICIYLMGCTNSGSSKNVTPNKVVLQDSIDNDDLPTSMK